ncbi:hypothetical protein [Methylibium petroleiphilum]|uniref:Uncharacterized protein n=1 Tax=Methylibium petroleiphilum (strain ATCC BAA-1232 / LMG 22953 / PM1) TaxID=420662 RepID=A2SN99_METPP|nr:hypothetical protein [Methylibium petroleiphilum]ABM97038.1 hypothetical protein Mpe_B0263 [Methylibium petroleiphilum PM1]
MFQVPNALTRPASKAQFHRAAEAMLRSMAEDLGQTQVGIEIDSNATKTSSMGSVKMTTPSLSLEVYMDAFGPRESPRLIYRDRFGNEQARSKWLSDLDASARSNLIQELRILARNARPGTSAASQSKGGFVRKFTGLFAA